MFCEKSERDVNKTTASSNNILFRIVFLSGYTVDDNLKRKLPEN